MCAPMVAEAGWREQVGTPLPLCPSVHNVYLLCTATRMFWRNVYLLCTAAHMFVTLDAT